MPRPISISGHGPLAATNERLLGAVARYLGAFTLLGVGIVHIEQFYVDSYRAVPTIGTLFAINFASATLVAAGLVTPLGDLNARWANRLRSAFAISGIGISTGSLAGLLVSEHGGVFGFREIGYSTPALASIALEAAAAVLLTLFLIMTTIRTRRTTAT